MPLAIRQSPFSIVAIQLKKLPLIMPTIERMQPHELAHDLLWHKFTFLPCTFLIDAAIPTEDEDSIFVLPEVRCVESYFTSSMEAEFFDEYTRLHPAITAGRSASTSARRARIPDDMVKRLKEEFPWLQDSDFALLEERQTTPSHARTSHRGSSSDGQCADVLDVGDVSGELHAYREA